MYVYEVALETWENEGGAVTPSDDAAAAKEPAVERNKAADRGLEAAVPAET